MLKKFFIGVGVLVGLFVIAALLIPVFVDANKYRPQIEKLVEENVNADLQLGSLSLSLWGGLHIRVEKLILSEKNSHGERPIVSLNDFDLKISIASLLSGKPDITVDVKSPEINVTVGPDGKMNISKLAKSSAETGKTQGGQNPEGKVVPAFVLSFKLRDGKIVYADQVKKTKTEVGGINFELKEFALNKPFSFSFDSNLDAKEMKDLVLRGPAKFWGTAGIYMGPSGLDHLDLEADADLSGLIVKYGTLFNKDGKAPLKVAVNLVATDKSLDIKRGHLQINDAAVDAQGKVVNFSQPIVDLTIASSQFNFEHWQQVISPLKEYDIKGSASFNIKATGPISKINLVGKAETQNMSLNAPGLVSRITDLNANIQFSSDTASLTKASLKMGASDLELDGAIRNFNKPIIGLNVRSKFLDVDSLTPQKSPAEVEKEQAASTTSQPVNYAKVAKGPIAALKANPVTRGLDFTGRLQVAKIHVHKADLTDLKAELTFKDLTMKLIQATANAFGGSGGFNATIDFRGVEPSYFAGGQVMGIDINAAITNQMPVAKDSLFGKASARFDVAGAGLSKTKVTSTLKGKGNFHIDSGSWSALKAMQAIGESLKKIPGAQAALGGINFTDKFKACKADFTIANGRINIVNMLADMEGAKTTITGQGYVDFDQNLSLSGKITTPAGSDIPNDIRSADGRLSIPYELGCKANAPCPKMDNSIRLVATAYAKKFGGDAVKKAIQDNVKDPAVKDLLKSLPF
jgi:uncharacterized protein involved in outer membrane biogenesis